MEPAGVSSRRCYLPSTMSMFSLPPNEEKTDFVRSMFDSIAYRYDFVNRLITLGLDRHWRKQAVGELGLAREMLVLDIGCGTGDLTREASRAGFVCIGIDLSYEMLAVARATDARFIEANAESLPIASASIDGVISGFALRNFTDSHKVFREIERVLLPGGRLVILEVDLPSNPFLRFGHRIWFHQVVPKIGALLSVASAYRYLPQSVTYLPNQTDLTAMLISSGFGDVRYRHLQGGLAQIVVCAKQGGPV